MAPSSPAQPRMRTSSSPVPLTFTCVPLAKAAAFAATGMVTVAATIVPWPPTKSPATQPVSPP